jgi:hypothetical protein
MLERRHGERRSTVRESTDRRRPVEIPMPLDAADTALAGLRFLHEEIRGYFTRHGHRARPALERAVRDWYGTLDARMQLLEACQHDAALSDAWRIVHAAGFQGASLLPAMLRRLQQDGPRGA